MKLASIFPNRYGILASPSEPLADNDIQLTEAPTGLGAISSPLTENRKAVAIGETSGQPHGDDHQGGDAAAADEDSLQARLDALRRG